MGKNDTKKVVVIKSRPEKSDEEFITERNKERLYSEKVYEDEKKFEYHCKWFKDGCGRRFKTISEAQHHQRAVHQEKHTCKLCLNDYFWRDYEKHIIGHGLPKPMYPSVVVKVQEKMLEKGVNDINILNQVEKNLIKEREERKKNGNASNAQRELGKQIAIQKNIVKKHYKDISNVKTKASEK